MSGRGEAQRINYIFNHALESLGVCVFVIATYPHVDVLIEFLNALTGWDATLEEVLRPASGSPISPGVQPPRRAHPLEYTVSGGLVGNRP